MKVFASCSSYVLGQLFGPVKACDLLTKAVANENSNPPCFAVQALRYLNKLAEVHLCVDGGASHIGKSRSRHFWNALQSECDVWVSIDDDVTADLDTLTQLLAAVDPMSGARVCIAPCLLRMGSVVNVEWSSIYTERQLLSGGTARRAVAGGFGLVAMNRDAMKAVARTAPEWLDPHDGLKKPAPFIERLTPDGKWVGEDLAFFGWLPREVEVEALTSGKTMHAGHELALEALRT